MKTDRKKRENKATGKKIGMLPMSILILIIIGFIAYSNSFTVPFHWDDIPQILEREVVHDPANFLEFSSWKKLNQRPVSQLSFALNYSIGGIQVTGYHLLNLLLHILTAFIVFLLSRLLIGLLDKDDRFDQRFRDGSSLIVALIFLIHPLQTMAVTYIVQRMTILAALFYVLAVYLYVRGRLKFLTEGNRNKSIVLLVLAVLLGILGVYSKQNAATFPAAFLLTELFFIRRTDGSICKKYIIAGLSVLVIGFIAVLLSGALPAETSNFSRIEYLSAQFGVFYRYLLLVLFPVSQNADYFIRVEPPLFGTAQFIGIFLVTAMAGLGVYLFKRNKLISFGIFWFLLSMSIESGIIPIRDIMMEHRMYLPLFGYGMIITGVIMQYVNYQSRIGLYVATGLVLIIMMVGTFNRNKVWQSSISLWEDCLDKNPENPRAMNNLGLAIKVNANHAPNMQVRTQALNTALQYFSNSIKGDTVFVQAHMNRGLTSFELGNYKNALADIAIVVDNRPKEKYLQYYIEGVALAKQGKLEAAEDKLDLALSLKDDFAQIYTWKGLVSAEMNHYQTALDSYKRSIELDPSQTILNINIADMHFYLKNYESALKRMKMARDAGEEVDNEYIRKLEELL